MQQKNDAIELREPLIVILTAFKNLAFERYLSEMGVSACYEKPIDADQLSQILRKASEWNENLRKETKTCF